MDKIRLANPQEIAEIQADADLGPTSTVVAFDNSKGLSDLAVLKSVTELDPVFYRSGSDSRKAAFIWALESALRLQGVPAYYFNVAAGEDTAQWREIVSKWGAEPVSKTPEIRFKKVLQ